MASADISKLSRRFRITRGAGFKLKDIDPAEDGGLDLKDEAGALLDKSVRSMADLQERLYPQDHWAVLFIFQALDAAGKDGTIKHVMSGLNPQGCEVHPFKAPSLEELDHDFMWRTTRVLPWRGHIGIFNRSYYEEVLVVRVHPEILASQRMPPQLVTKRIWDERFEDINHFERYLRAYEDAIRSTASSWAPWYVVPADRKWFARLVVASAVIETLEALRPSFPKIDEKKRREIQAARATLLSEATEARKHATEARKH